VAQEIFHTALDGAFGLVRAFMFYRRYECECQVFEWTKLYTQEAESIRAAVDTR